MATIDGSMAIATSVDSYHQNPVVEGKTSGKSNLYTSISKN